MKHLLLTSLAALTLTTTATLAEGDNGLYLGLGYASTNIDVTIDNISERDQKLLDSSTDSIILQLGYDFNANLGVEGRYYANNSGIAFDYYLGGTPLEGTYKAETFAVYAKPQYNMGVLTIYGLLGMASNDYTVRNLVSPGNDTLFSWGGGAKFNVTQSLGLFVDYTDLGETEDALTDTGLNSWNIGVSYKF
jgi:opacity protein-like surface antigen